MQNRDRLYINGQWVESTGKDFIDVINAANEEVMGRIPAGTPEDVDAAVAAARGAFEGWAATPVEERAAALARLHEGLTERAEEIAVTIAGEVGMPLKLSRRIQAGLPSAVMESYVRLLSDFSFEERIGNSLVVREPVGVVGCITPWNYPLNQVVAKVAPALAAGCTVVLKPSQETPLHAFLLAEMIQDCGLPAGVFNLVSGPGSKVGEALARHPDVDMVSFTGSTGAGVRVAAAAAPTVKRVCLELGGKSAFIVGADADLAAAVRHGVQDLMINSGQTCTALSRMLLPASRYAEALQLAVAECAALCLGDPLDPPTFIGPMCSASQRRTVQDYIRLGREEGARLLCGGSDTPAGLERGYYVRPTLFADVDNRMRIAQEEIFGPVLCLIPYADEEEAIRIANDSPFGLSSAVWTASRERSLQLARQLRAGQCFINGAAFNYRAPFGGYKQSGNGREWGEEGLHEFVEIKAIQI